MEGGREGEKGYLANEPIRNGKCVHVCVHVGCGSIDHVTFIPRPLLTFCTLAL